MAIHRAPAPRQTVQQPCPGSEPKERFQSHGLWCVVDGFGGVAIGKVAQHGLAAFMAVIGDDVGG